MTNRYRILKDLLLPDGRRGMYCRVGDTVSAEGLNVTETFLSTNADWFELIKEGQRPPTICPNCGQDSSLHLAPKFECPEPRPEKPKRIEVTPFYSKHFGESYCVVKILDDGKLAEADYPAIKAAIEMAINDVAQFEYRGFKYFKDGRPSELTKFSESDLQYAFNAAREQEFLQNKDWKQHPDHANQMYKSSRKFETFEDYLKSKQQ